MREPESTGSIAAMTMNTDRILEQLSCLKDDTPDSTATDALEAAIDIISTLQHEGISDAEGVKDLIFDYNALGKQYKELHLKHIKAAAPVHKDGVWHCPECNARTSFNHSYCHKCGKRLGGWKK